MGFLVIALFSLLESRGQIHLSFPLWPFLSSGVFTGMIILGLIAKQHQLVWYELLFRALLPGLSIVLILLVLQRMMPTSGEYWYVALWAVIGGRVAAGWFYRRHSNSLRFIPWVAVILSLFVSALYRDNVGLRLTQGLILLLALLWGTVMWIVAQRADETTIHRSWEHWWWRALIALVLVWGVWLRFAAATAFPLQNDEFFHVDAARGYLESGDYRLWDYQTQTLGASYMRAWPFTWQVAQSMRFVGATEWALRLPSLVWGVIFLLGAAFATYRFTRSLPTTFFLTAIVAFDPGFIWAASTVRMYAMFSVLALAVLMMALRACAPPPLPWRQRTAWGLGAVVLTLLSVIIHPTALLLLVGMGVACIVSAIRFPQERWFRIAALVLLVPALVSFLFLPTLQEVLQARFFTVRSHLNTQYLQYPFQNFIVPILALLLVIAGVFVARLPRTRQWMIVSMCMALPTLFYFVYLAPRYGARKYSMFVLIALFFIIAHTWHSLQSVLWRGALGRTVGSTAIFAWLFVPLAIPGVASSWLFAPARADQPLAALEFHDYPSAYAFLNAHATPDEVILMLSPRSFYLQHTALVVTQIPPEKKMTIRDLQLFLEEHPRGWIVWPRYKSFHLRPEVQQLIAQRFPEIITMTETNMIMYRYDVSRDDVSIDAE